MFINLFHRTILGALCIGLLWPHSAAAANQTCISKLLKGRTARVLALTAASLYVAPHAYLYYYQRDMIFQPTHQSTSTDEAESISGVSSFYQADGSFLGYLRAKSETPKRVVLYFMGNAGQISDWVPTITSQIEDPDTAVVLMEYPGYGGRPGQPSQNNFYRAGVAAFDQIKARWPQAGIRVYGYSMGSSVATYVAAQRSVEKVALASPFHSLAQVAQSEYPYLIIEPLVKDSFPTYAYAKSVTAPVMIVHGDTDELIPLSQARRLSQLFPNGSQLLVVPSVGHALTSGEEKSKLADFLQN